jgi:hypothetical protein
VTAQREAALAYAEAGALVLPLHTPVTDGCSCRHAECASTGKHPRTLRGLDDATSSIETVTRWWHMWPTANAGVRPPKGVVILDVDPRNGGGTSLQILQRKHGILPPTQTVATGGGGLHIWVTFYGPTRGKVAPGIDVKTNSGYVVMPPSLHESGRRYSWVNDRAGIRPAPDWLAALLAPAAIPQPAGARGTASPARAEALLRFVADSKEGARNSRLFWACARAIECGLDINPLIQAAVAVGLPEAEAMRAAASAARRVVA